MNHERFDADIALAMGPCADFEFDLVELSEQALDPGRLPAVQEHLAQCARCTAYLAELRSLDQALAATLPQPSLSPEFDARLAERIAGLQRIPDRARALADAEQEHAQLLRALGRAFDWRTALNAVALGAATGGALLALDSIAPGLLQGSGFVPAGFSAAGTYAIALALAFVGGGLGFARRIAAGSLLRAGV